MNILRVEHIKTMCASEYHFAVPELGRGIDIVFFALQAIKLIVFIYLVFIILRIHALHWKYPNR